MERIRSRARDLVGETSSTTLAIATGVFLLLIIIVLPQVIPGGRFGVACTALAHPIPGGNNQSLLSDRSANALDLQVAAQFAALSTVDPLIVNVTFVNRGVGSIILFFAPEESLLRDDGSAGLSFLVTGYENRAIYGEPTTVRPPAPQRTQFPTEVLYVLPARGRCTEQITFDPVRLSNAGIGAGRYLLRGIYRNPFAGTIDIVPGATATPIFPDQGVYVTNELRSNEVEFTVGIAPG